MAPDTRDEFDRVADTIPFRQLDSERARTIIADLFRQAQAAKSCATCQHGLRFQDDTHACREKSILRVNRMLSVQMPVGFSCSLHAPRAEDGSR